MPDIFHYNSKAIVAGSLVEVYDYEATQFFNYKRSQFERRQSEDTYDSTDVIGTHSRDRLKEDMERAIKKVKLLIASNTNSYKDSRSNVIKTKFITLTFENHVDDIDKARECLKLFNRKLKRRLNGVTPAYLGVHEKQDNGRCHFHMVYFNIPYISVDEISGLWKMGAVDIEGVKGTINDANNLSRYICKSFQDKAENKASYIRSRNLIEPLNIKNDYLVGLFKHKAQNCKICSYSYLNEHTGSTTYTAYDLSGLTYEERNELLENLNYSPVIIAAT